MIVVFQSLSGSPGASVWTTLGSGLWPSDNPLERVGVEADLDGGVMAVRYQLESKTDLLLAEAPLAEGAGLGDMSLCAHKVGNRAWLVPGPKAPEAVRRRWLAAGGVDSVAQLALRDSRVWMFDVGRASPTGVMAPLFASAAVSVLFVRGSSEELTKVRGRLVELKDTGAHVMVAVTGRLDHREDEVKEFVGTRHVMFLPDDGHLVEDSRQVWSGGKRGRRRGVWVAGSAFMEAIAEVLSFSPRGVMRVEAKAS